MKNFTYKNTFNLLKSKGILMIGGGLLLVSCGSQMGGYSETDGVYYDPNKDVMPEGVVMQETNQVGEVYDYSPDTLSTIQQTRKNEELQKSKYKRWGNNDQTNQESNSDWGTYSGTQINYYNNNWGWGYPYGFGWSPYYGSRFGLGFGYTYGWGSPWSHYYGYNSYWDWGFGNYYYPSYYYGNPYFYGYNPYYGYYNPYYGYGYSPYYGYNYYNTPRYNYRRSGADGNSGNGVYKNSQPVYRTQQEGGFRNNQVRTTNPNASTGEVTPRPRYRSNNSTMQDQTPAPTTQQPRFRNFDSGSSNSGGYNSGSSGGGFRSGSGNSGSSGSSSSSSGGGFRSGGFR